MLKVTAPDGKQLLRTSVTSRPLPHVESVPPQRALTLDDVHDWMPAMGSGRMVSAVGLVGTRRGR
jgi:two-component system heavy metal sensor histidine kinase CusS